MKALRKYGGVSLAILFIVFMVFSGTNSCSSDNGKKIKPSKNGTYEPKFNKDGDLWLVKASTKDTLFNMEVEYADSYDKIEYGMMYRKSMKENTSMLFFMGDMQMRSFWMKNTYVSLDIVYIDDKMRIVSIQRNAEPLNTRSLPSDGPAMYVLEIKGGLSDKIGLSKGDLIYFQDI